MACRTRWNRFRAWARSVRDAYNVFHCDKEFFVAFDACALVGKIHLDSKHHCLRRLWKLFRLGMVLVFGLLAWRFYLDGATGEIGFVQLINNMFIGSILAVTVIRSVLIAWNYEEVSEVRQYCNERRFLRDDLEVVEIRRKAYFVVKNLTVVILANMVVFLSAPSLMIQVEAFRLPFAIPGWHALTFICQKVHILMLMTVGVNFTLNFLVIFTTLYGIITEGRVLHLAFSRIFNRDQSDRDEFFWTQLNDRFDECILQHTILLEKIARMRNLYESTFLVTYYSTTVHIAGGAFFLVSTSEPFDVYMLQMINVIAMQIIECFVLTRWTTVLKDVLESIGDTVYKLNWYQELRYSERFTVQYRAARAGILLTMERCNQPLRFSRGAHFEFTQDKFTQLMNTAYTLVTFLWDMRH